MNFIKIASRDISSTFKNRFLRVSVIAIIIVPLLYSLLYLAAFWDPYSKLTSMPVAVVNLDKGTTKDDEKVNYGQDIIDKLKNNSKVGWHFVSLEDAENGVKGKGYYGMFIIPDDFSQKIISAKDGKPEKASIKFIENDKKNFLASQINGKVEVELKSEINKSITDEYTKTAFDSLYEVKDGMIKAADGSKELKEGINTAKDGSSSLKDGTAKLNSSVPELSKGVNELYNGSLDLNKGIKTASDGAAQLNGGFKQFMGLALTPVSDGIKSLYGGLNEKLVPSMYEIKVGNEKLSNGLNTVKDGVATLNNGAAGLNDAVNGQVGLKNGADSLKANSSILKQGSDNLNAGYNQIVPAFSQLKEGTAQVSAGVDDLINGVNESQNTLGNATDNYLKAYIAKHPEAAKDPDMLNFLNTLNTLQSNSKDPQNLAKMAALKDGAAKAAKGADNLSAGTQGFIEGAEKFSQGSLAYANGAQTFAAGAEKFSYGASQFASGANQFASGLNSAIDGSEKLKIGSNQLYEGINGEYRKGLEALNTNMPLVVGGAKQLYDASASLANGLNAIADGSSKLSSGLEQMKGKIPELSDGTSQLADGASKLYDGMIKLSDGSSELNNKLSEGADKITNNLKTQSKDMGEFVSEPVIMKEAPINQVKDYGTGFTPYFVPLSLWVGALMMFFVITDKVDDDIEAGSASLVLGKFLSYGYIGILQALLVSVVVLILGLKPSNVPLYFMVNIFMSFVFIAIIQSLIFLLGEAGRLLSIVLLILQLTSCAGTFPLEVVPKFFKVLNPVMPFTYCVSALREVISGIDYSVLKIDFLVMAGMLIVFLMISILMKGHADKLQDRVRQRKEVAA